MKKTLYKIAWLVACAIMIHHVVMISLTDRWAGLAWMVATCLVAMWTMPKRFVRFFREMTEEGYDGK